MNHRRFTCWILLAVVLPAACSGSSLEPETQVTIGHFSSDQAIQVPTSVTVGQGFLVEVTTVGDGCVDHSSTQVAVNGLVATVIPLDEVAIGVPCQGIEKHFRHAGIVRFHQTGQAVVRIQGLNTTIERPVLVR